MIRRQAVVLASMLWALGFAVAAAQEAPPNATAILLQVKAGLRASELPEYVVYTLVRRESLEDAPDFLNSYSLRIWCRTADRAALSRRFDGRRVTGPAQFITPQFDKPIDPGPPTADVLDVIRQSQSARAPAESLTPAPDASVPIVIGSVSVVIERNYHVTYAGLDRNDYHLHLDALRDLDRNRLTELYVDRTSYAVHRAVAHDHLYVEGRVVPERFEIDFGRQDRIPVIVAIHGETDYSAPDARRSNEPFHAVDYRFEDIAFPAALPLWYFDPREYGAHRSELPS